MVGDGFGIGWANADIDHGDAALTIAFQMVGWHLWLPGQGFTLITAIAIGNAVAGFDK